MNRLNNYPIRWLLSSLIAISLTLQSSSTLHPGGREILLRFNRRDASQAFKKINHSANAQQMLSKYLIGSLEGSGGNREEVNIKTIEEISLAETIKQKLFTHEDTFHLHKILGSIVVLHFAVRMLLLLIGTGIFLGTGDKTIFLLNQRLDPIWLLITMAVLHGLLSLSALQFSVPKKANQSKPMIHDLFRAHSINFALRAVICMIIYILLQDNLALRNLALSITVLATFIIADILSEKLTDKNDKFDTTASMPYWFGISLKRQKLHKFLYGYGQFLASFICLLGGYGAALYTLAPIQGAAFGMTLVRKNILNVRLYHNIYLLLLFLPIPFAIFVFPIKVAGSLLFTLFLFYLRTLGVNKYVLWLPILAGCNLLLLPEHYRFSFHLALFVLAGIATLINLIIIRTKKIERIDKNNRIISSAPIDDNITEVIIRTKFSMNLLPDQQVLIRLSDKFEQKYTPIWTKAIEDTDQTLICLHIKKDSQTNKESSSHFLINSEIGTTLDLHGPISTSLTSS